MTNNPPKKRRISQGQLNRVERLAERLPDTYLVAIGDAITVFAQLEHELRRASFAAVGVSYAIGKTAVRMPSRSKEVVEMIGELAVLKQFSLTVDLKKLAGLFDQIEQHRDMLAHGAWFISENDGIPRLLDMSGKYDAPFTGFEAPFKRRVLPAAKDVPIAQIEGLSAAARRAREYVRTLATELRAEHEAWQRKLLERSQRKNRPGDRE